MCWFLRDRRRKQCVEKLQLLPLFFKAGRAYVDIFFGDTMSHVRTGLSLLGRGAYSVIYSLSQRYFKFLDDQYFVVSCGWICLGISSSFTILADNIIY